jgi:hypothetical protein
VLCCIAIAFVIGTVRQGWRTLTFAGDTGPVTPLPPAARRPQPGAAPVAPSPEPARTRRRWESDVLTPARAALELRFAAAGIAFYAGVIALLGIAGAADGSAGATGWILRDALFVVLAVMALIVARSCAGSAPSPRGRERLACALMGAGAVWLELGLLDMHFFGLFDIAHGALVWDALFHGAAAVAFAAGWALLVTDTGVRTQTWRHELSTAS